MLGGVALGLALSAGCNISKLTADTTAGMVLAGTTALDQESDIDFARESLPASLKTLETFLVSSPENPDLLLLLARGYNSYAFGFIEADLDREGEVSVRGEKLSRRAVLHYIRGRDYGFRLLNDPALEQAALKGDVKALKAALAGLKIGNGKKDRHRTAGLFWAAYGWISAINLGQADPAMIAGLGPAKLLIEKAYELDPNYNGGAPILVRAVLHAATPKALGGKPEVAKKFFDEAMAKHGETNLLVPFMYARFYASSVQDKKLYVALMAKVNDADIVALPPNMRLNNEIARDRARFWGPKVGDLILE